jgi:hypothetical protein
VYFFSTLRISALRITSYESLQLEKVRQGENRAWRRESGRNSDGGGE